MFLRKLLEKSLFFAALSLSISIASCSLFGEDSYYHQQQKAYSKAKDGPGLVVPPPLTSSKLGDAYVIPPTQTAPPAIEAPPPPGSALAKEVAETGVNNAPEPSPVDSPDFGEN